MVINTSTLRPGLLVSLKTTVKGNVSYVKETIEGDTEIAPGKHRAKWETTRTIEDAAEHEEATKVRGKARWLISSVCSPTTFGLLCREDRADELEKAIAEARALAGKFNSMARITEVEVYVIAGRVASDDAEAIKAINSEMSDLMGAMADGIKTLDVAKVRDAANRAKSVGKMLSPGAADQVKVAVEAARAAARKIVATGEQAVQEIDLEAVRAITEARGAFLDLGDEVEVLAPVESGRGIDLMPEDDVKIVAPAEAAVALEF